MAVENYTVVELVAWQRWHHLNEVLRRSVRPVFDGRTTDRLPEDHIVHLACQRQAPVQTVQLLGRKYPRSLSSAEANGRYPVHVACASGSPPDAVEFLIRSHPPSAGARDVHGKTPLMYACESYARCWRAAPRNRGRSPDLELLSVVAMLLDEALWSAVVEDGAGACALEYALDSGAPIVVYKRIQNASKDAWRRMRVMYRGKSHEELRQSFTGSGSSGSSFNSLDSSHLDDEMDTDDACDHMDVTDHETNIRIARIA